MKLLENIVYSLISFNTVIDSPGFRDAVTSEGIDNLYISFSEGNISRHSSPLVPLF